VLDAISLSITASQSNMKLINYANRDEQSVTQHLSLLAGKMYSFLGVGVEVGIMVLLLILMLLLLVLCNLALLAAWAKLCAQRRGILYGRYLSTRVQTSQNVTWRLMA
jgi:hypothetical protein